MKLLIITQTVDTADPILGFFVQWIAELSTHFERIEVVALKVGQYELPANVRVHSLGKERGAASRAAYAWRFLHLAWALRHDYDAVFVHMNEEYVLLAGFLWKLLGKRIYMWRNHYAGSWRTRVAAALSTKVFCTSKHSYTARFKKTVLMPVGVDTDRFKPDPEVPRTPRSVLFLARMAPSKRPEMLLDALASLARDQVEFTADFVGSPLPQDAAWYEALKTRAAPLAPRVRFLPGVANAETVRLYQSHQIFVNASPSGMFDKTLFEAAASGAAVLASSKDFAALAGQDTNFDSAEALAERLRAALTADAQEAPVIARHSLGVLGKALYGAIYSQHAV